MKWLLKSLLKSLLVLIALVVASATLPFASFWLCRDHAGAQVFFWVAPWTCAFWSILAYNLIGSKFWRGREAVEGWRARRGGYRRSVAKGTAWMFASLFFSYGCEFGVLWETHSPGWRWLPPPISPSLSRSHGAAVGKITPFRKPRRLTPELVGELLRIHSSCMHSQEHRCPLLVSVKSLTWELDQAANIGNDEERGFRRTDSMCAARPLDFEEGE